MTTAIRMVPRAAKTPAYCESAITYDSFMDLMDQLAESGATTGAEQSERHVQFTFMNNRRMKRWNKTIEILPELQEMIASLTKQVCFLAITESWCGDAAHTLPLFYKLAEMNPNLQMKVVFRDENPELINRYLTNGKRSIPIVVVFVNENGAYRETFHWGPYTKPVQEFKANHASHADGLSGEDYQKFLQSWYNNDKSLTLQREFLEKLKVHLA